MAATRIVIRTEFQRAELLRAIVKRTGVSRRTLRLGRQQHLPAGYRLVGAEQDTIAVARCASQEEVRELLPTFEEWPVTVTLRRPVNTQVVEHGWRPLNRHRHTLRCMPPHASFFLLYRIAHLHNLQTLARL